LIGHDWKLLLHRKAAKSAEKTSINKKKRSHDSRAFQF
jgi:hypothetical protein